MGSLSPLPATADGFDAAPKRFRVVHYNGCEQMQQFFPGFGSAAVGLGRALPGADAGRSQQLEEALQEGLDVFVGFVRRRFLVVGARKSFFITRIAWRKRLLRLAV